METYQVISWFTTFWLMYLMQAFISAALRLLCSPM
jgi:hypothetical protein